MPAPNPPRLARFGFTAALLIGLLALGLVAVPTEHPDRVAGPQAGEGQPGADEPGGAGEGKGAGIGEGKLASLREAVLVP